MLPLGASGPLLKRSVDGADSVTPPDLDLTTRVTSLQELLNTAGIHKRFMTLASSGGRSRLTTALMHLLIALSGPTAPSLIPQGQVCSQVLCVGTGVVLLYVHQHTTAVQQGYCCVGQPSLSPAGLEWARQCSICPTYTASIMWFTKL